CYPGRAPGSRWICFALAAMPRIYTKTGDDGTTGLLYGGRVSKADGATEAYGTVDEAGAPLGGARAACEDGAAGPGMAPGIVRLQRGLFVVGADLATNPDERDRLVAGVSLVTSAMTATLESEIDRRVEAKPLPNAFVVPGANPLSAALDVARSVVRRAE